MQNLKHDPKSGVLHPGWLLAVRVFIGIAFLVGTYLLVVSLQGMNMIGCGPDSGCEKVLHSRWAYWFGLPVSAFALAVYASIFAGTFWLNRKTNPVAQRKTWALLAPASVMVVGAALWFVVLQFFVIKAICPYCMVAHGSGVIAALLILLSAPFAPVPETPSQGEKAIYIGSGLAKRLVLLALAGVAALVAGQTLHQKKSFAVTTIPDSSPVALASNAVSTAASPAGSNAAPTTNLAASTPATNAPAGPIPPNPYAGMFYIVYQTNVLDLREVPIIGSSNAPYVMVSLYDYTCRECRNMHEPLMESFRTFSNKLAIVSLPMPLDPQCNYTVKTATGMHTNGCKYARMALAVWRTDRAKLRQFDDFMFAGINPPTVQAAQDFASNLLGGPEAFARALQDPWVEQQLQRDIGIYAYAFNQGRGTMPQIIVGRRAVLGGIDVEELNKIIAKEFGLASP